MILDGPYAMPRTMEGISMTGVSREKVGQIDPSKHSHLNVHGLDSLFQCFHRFSMVALVTPRQPTGTVAPPCSTYGRKRSTQAS